MVSENADELTLFVNQWYDMILKYEFDLLYTYANDVEAQIKKGIKEFEEAEPIKEFLLDGQIIPVPHTLIIHKDLDSESWDLPSVFKEYFPRLQRNSAIITIYSFFEHKLDSLCISCQTFYKFKIGRESLKEEGIKRSFEYLKLVMELSIVKKDPKLVNVDSIRLIRNLVVHNDNKVPREEKDRIDKIVNGSNFLEIDNENRVVILEGYLQYCLNEFNLVFQYVEKLLKDKLANTPK